MPRKPKTTASEATNETAKPQPILSAELLNQLIPGPVSQAQL
ncbi:hypothetical protein SDC9_130979 [bioreactor metagenome]|uniref:Uncharacterized protein n=1 Tax=bioreactor metagenome TaxID=1076179 RepID=A0A645D3X8_9ZZZZ